MRANLALWRQENGAPTISEADLLAAE
jgi:hypothetical protein